MERSSEHRDLATALAEARPEAQEEFVRALDERVAAGFPRRSRPRGTPLSMIRDHLLITGPGRLLFAGASAALAAIAVATVLVSNAGEQPEQSSHGGLLSELSGSSESTESAPAPATHGAGGSAASGGAELQFAPA